MYFIALGFSIVADPDLAGSWGDSCLENSDCLFYTTCSAGTRLVVVGTCDLHVLVYVLPSLVVFLVILLIIFCFRRRINVLCASID